MDLTIALLGTLISASVGSLIGALVGFYSEGHGVRSAVTYFTLRLVGFPRVTLFTGSFNEWSSHLDLPITAGNEP